MQAGVASPTPAGAIAWHRGSLRWVLGIAIGADTLQQRANCVVWQFHNHLFLPNMASTERQIID